MKNSHVYDVGTVFRTFLKRNCMAENIIVVGAGAAGLKAASDLATRNYRVTVVEARDRIGGRIHTMSGHFSRPVDVGAEFIHGNQPITIDLAEKANVSLQRLAGNHFRIAKGALKDGGDLFNDEWDVMLTELSKLKADMPMAAFLDRHFNQQQHSDFYASVKGFVEGFDAADLDKVSAFALRDEWENTDDEQQYHLKGTYHALMQQLEKAIKAGGGEITLSSPVRTILWASGKVQVILDDDRIFEGDRVIVTVPIGVLQRRGIVFVPDIPKHQQAFGEIGFGGVVKFIFEFDQPFWEYRVNRPLKNAAFIFSDAQVPTWWTRLPDATPLLTGWMGGPRTLTLDRSDKALYERALSSLSYIFDCSPAIIEQHLRHFYIADWVKDPYAHGAYAYATVNTAAARKLLMTPIDNTLYFAGEAIYDGPAMGTVEAALASGRNVAEVIFSRNEIIADSGAHKR